MGPRTDGTGRFSEWSLGRYGGTSRESSLQGFGLSSARSRKR